MKEVEVKYLERGKSGQLKTGLVHGLSQEGLWDSAARKPQNSTAKPHLALISVEQCLEELFWRAR
jgi:hypothetical protein